MDLTSGPHLSVSALRRVANSAGVEDCASKPMVANPLTVSGAAKAARKAVLSRAKISLGVLAGKKKPNHSLKTNF